MISVCSKCATIGRSGKSSCCGRGGSWFGNCGNAGDTTVEHRWYEGLQVCRTGSGQESIVAEEMNSSDGVGNETSEAVILATTKFEVNSTDTSTPIPFINHPMIPAANASIDVPITTLTSSVVPMSVTTAVSTTIISTSANATTASNTSIVSTESTDAIPHTKNLIVTTPVSTVIAPANGLVHTTQEAAIVSVWISQSTCYTCHGPIMRFTPHLDKIVDA